MTTTSVESLPLFLEACAESSVRVRNVVILTVIVSIISFGAYWNSRPSSWYSQFRDLYQSTERLLEIRTELALPTLSSDRKKVLEAELAGSKLQRAETFLKEVQKQRGYTISDPKQLEPEFKTFRELRTEHVAVVSIPFFGIYVHVNDAALLSGFSLTILMIWLRLSIWRDYQNLRITFEHSRSCSIQGIAYRLLEMRQVLLIPRQSPSAPHTDKLWRTIPKILLALPMLVQTVLLSHHVLTYGRGFVVSPTAVLVSMIGTLLFWILLALLTRECVALAVKLDQEWSKFLDEAFRDTGLGAA